MLGAGHVIAASGLVTLTTSGVSDSAQGVVGIMAAFCYDDPPPPGA